MDSINDLTAAFKKFPGLGSRSARRIVFYLLKQDERELKQIGGLIANLKEDLKTCSECGNISNQDPCPICSDPLRDRKTLCIVEDLESLSAFEQAKIYNGIYHVLGGRISPLDGEELSDDSAKFLLRHVKKLKPSEIIIATSTSIEGDMTLYTLEQLLRGIKNAKITRLAFGLPLGSSIEFADKLTLHASLDARRPI